MKPKRVRFQNIDSRLPPEEYDRQWIASIKARCVVDENGCWLWTRGYQPFRNQRPDQLGYAAGSYRGERVRIHRKMLEIKLGQKLPREILACHTCDVHHCCNPDHIWAGTCQQNMRDMADKKRNKAGRTHCPRGHEYAGDNLRVHSNGRRRGCKLCDRIRQRLYAGWSEEEALSLPAFPQGARTPRRTFKNFKSGSAA